MTAKLDGVEERIRGFICSELGFEPEEIGDDTPLFSSGMVDSFTFVGMIAMLEAELGFQLDPTAITVEHFDSISSMVAFLRETVA